MLSEDRVPIMLNEITQRLSKIDSIIEVRLFGSQVYKYNSNSDVDILILCKGKLNYGLILEFIANISIKNEILVHPVIYYEDQEEIKTNVYINDNIFEKSKILYQKKSN